MRTTRRTTEVDLTVYAELDTADSRRIAVETEYRHKELIKQIPGSNYSAKDKIWKVPLGWTGCLALRTTFGNELVVGPKLTEWASNEYATRIAPSMALRQATEAEGSPSLYGYQRAGVAFLSVAKRALLADEMGTGKTRQAYMAMMQLHMNGENPFPALVVAPNSTKISWKREGELVWPGLQITVVKGSAAQRRKQLEEPAHVYVMNWESVRGHSRLAPFGSIALKRCPECGGTDEKVNHTSCEVHPRELNQIEFKTVIGDEIHRAKDPRAKQTRAFWAATGDAPFRFGLSGTPIANAVDDLWTVLHWLSPDEWPGKTAYMDRFCDIAYNAFGAATVMGVKHHMEAEFFGGLDPRLRRMPKALVLDFLPPVRSERRDVEMAPKQKKAYEQMRDQMVAELKDDELYQTTSPLTRVMRMLQFASSYAEIERVERFNQKTQKMEIDEYVRLHDPSCKLDAFMNDIDDFGEDSVVVFAVSRQLIEMLSARMTKANIPHGLITGAQDADERQQHMDDFQAGKTKFILCTIAAGGTGITLTKARVAVFLQRDWSMINNYQAEARIHRIGSEQHESVVMIDYITADTMEEVVIDAVERKSRALERVLRDKSLLEIAMKDNHVDESAHQKDESVA